MIKAWMVIGAVTLLVALGSSFIRPRDTQWFKGLQRPDWLVFEAAIPVIWTIIFVCGAWSAVIVWENDPGSPRTWLLMGLYLLLEVITSSYTVVMLRRRSLRTGTLIGGTGAVLGILLTLIVWPISGWAALLLLPYDLWSPVGTFTTWQITQLNPDAA